MIAVISPAKKLNFNADSPIKAFTQCDFLDESKKLVDKAKDYTFDDIMKLMSVSENIANLTVQRFQDWNLPFDEQNAKQAALAFNGDTYTGLDAETFSQDDFNYSQDHLRILSGLYGLLRPLDLIQPYRLEMGTTMNNSKGKNLYEFWGTKISEQLNRDVNNHKSKYIVNCASDEYFKVIDLPTLNVPVIKPIFKDVKNGVPKVISFFAKRARGMMSKFIIKNRVQSIDDLHGFNDNGYKFQPAQSENHELLYIRG
ncbi:MAG: peroxide stress protein YaaA [Candidatus Neomarinimicrobiota bacterium]|nr:peroxide stress protein YaaA [Candidatus Neomarinimicrobiota bacterium]|tara:strand:- start:1797 stop:2564 length:768 start_codon:yes stop_codon:yes gene_type:complete